MLFTLAAYTYYTKEYSQRRRIQIRQKKEAEKLSEFYLNESIMNYETVKAFNNEDLEKNRYSNLLETLRDNGLVV